MINRIFLSLAATIISISTFAQTDAKEAEKKAQASRYLLPEFVKGTVLQKTGKRAVVNMNYDVITQEIMFEQEGKQLALVAELVDTVYMKNRKFVGGSTETSFYEVSGSGKTAVYVKHAATLEAEKKDMGYGSSESSMIRGVSVITNNEAGGSGSAGAPAMSNGGFNSMAIEKGQKLKDVSTYWSKKNDKYTQINNFNQLIKLYPDKESKIQDFIRTNRVMFTDKAGMMELIYMLAAQ